MPPKLRPLHSLCAIALCLASCASPPPSSAREMVETDKLASVKMPVLRSSYFEKKWGAPDVEGLSGGGYRLRYRQGTTLNFVIIEGLTKMEPVPANPPDWEEPHDDPEGTTPAPAPHKQAWRHTTIAGVPVKWFQADGGSGADFPAYRTVDFAATAPDGRAGRYRITVCSDEDRKAADWIHRVNW